MIRPTQTKSAELGVTPTNAAPPGCPHHTQLASGVIGVQSATRVSIEDGKQFQRQVNRSLENMSWQVAGAGKAQNQSLKDVTISSSRMLQGINDHLNKQGRLQKAWLKRWKTWRVTSRPSMII